MEDSKDLRIRELEEQIQNYYKLVTGELKSASCQYKHCKGHILYNVTLKEKTTIMINCNDMRICRKCRGHFCNTHFVWYKNYPNGYYCTNCLYHVKTYRSYSITNSVADDIINKLSVEVHSEVDKLNITGTIDSDIFERLVAVLMNSRIYELEIRIYLVGGMNGAAGDIIYDGIRKIIKTNNLKKLFVRNCTESKKFKEMMMAVNNSNITTISFLDIHGYDMYPDHITSLLTQNTKIIHVKLYNSIVNKQHPRAEEIMRRNRKAKLSAIVTLLGMHNMRSGYNDIKSHKPLIYIIATLMFRYGGFC